MRIKSLVVRNYRMHRERRVDFDAARTLIGGPNEIGKSTLVEALHRAFFLKAKGNTEHHRAMQSALHPGHPEVEVVFDANGREHRLQKRFGGSGNTNLASAGEPVRTGDAAEECLAGLLQVDAGVSGKAVLAQWAHLWVWQGQAGEDPSGHATEQQASLLKRLQSDGAAAALQSDSDARVAERFATAANEIFTKNGTARANSQLERAQTSVASASTYLNNTRTRAEKLESAAVEVATAKREIPTVEASLSDLKLQRQEIEIRAAEIVGLQRTEDSQAQALAEAEKQLINHRDADRKIRDTRADIDRLQTELKPRRDHGEALARSLDAARNSAEKTEQQYRSAADTLRTCRLHFDLAAAHRRQIEAHEQRQHLDNRNEKVKALHITIAENRNELAKLPAVTETELTRLRNCESNKSTANARLEAMAAGLEILSGGLVVQIDGHVVEHGKRHILTEDTEIEIGNETRLRITPGGGTSLNQARKDAADATADFQESLDALGLDSVMAAALALSKRESAERKISDAEQRLDELNADALQAAIDDNERERNKAISLVERLRSQVDDATSPTSRTEAMAVESRWQDAVNESESAEQTAKQDRDAAFNARESLEAKLKEHRDEIEKQLRNLDELNGKLRLLVETHGDDEERAAAISVGKANCDQSRAALEKTRQTLTNLQPDLIDADRERINRSLDQKKEELNNVRIREAGARHTLHMDGTEDPRSDLAAAEARAKSAQDHLDSVRRQCDAIALLDRLFREEQRSLAEQFTGPLAKRISGYLKCVFGPTAEARISLEDNQFKGLTLHRTDAVSGAFEFDRLSGGTKEQLAAAVRLAMAELLAEEHDGCLPAVFDDAFAFSDPLRVRQLQRMLDLAANRGLQIVVLTCNPADYAGLGALQVTLDRETWHESPGEPTGQAASPIQSATNHGDETLQQGFLQHLHALEGKAGNGALRESLGWDESTYNRIKDVLLTTGAIVSGRGRGGSVTLVGDPSVDTGS